MKNNLTRIAVMAVIAACSPMSVSAASSALPAAPPLPLTGEKAPLMQAPTAALPAVPVPPQPQAPPPPGAVTLPLPAPPAAVPDAKTQSTGSKAPLDKAATPPAAASAEPVSLATLERFRLYTGPRTPAALAALFATPAKAVVRQTPEIVLSNGAASVMIETTLPAASGTAPNFALSGAKMLSQNLSKKGVILVEALPDAGATKAELIVISGSNSLEIPLNIAPSLPAEIDVSERAFVMFLNDKDPATKAKRDLNGDGRNDYQDDYIFAANYLLNKSDTSTTTVRGAEPTRNTRTWEAPTPAADPTDPAQSAGTAKSSGFPGAPAASGSESVSAPAFSSGWANSSGSAAPTTTGTGATNTITNIIVAPASNTSNTTSTGNNTNTTTGTNTNTNTNTNTGANTNQNSTGGTRITTTGSGISKVTTLTSADGSVTTTYVGQDNNNLNLRNQKAKELLQSIKTK